jgi:uncharacterized repeat protein (TIGR03803 family)
MTSLYSGWKTVKKIDRQTALILGMALACLLWFGADARAQGTYSVLYSFLGGTSDGANPFGKLIADSSGNLYGTTDRGSDQYCGPIGNNLNHGCGTVFELVNSGGTYTEKLLHSFAGESGDGYHPYGGLIMDGAGNLFGTTLYGGSSAWGTVFELVNSSGTYTEKVLYGFGGSSTDGQYPLGDLIMDASGNLYGTTETGGSGAYYGTVFELVNSSGTYTEKVLHIFAGTDGAYPLAGLIMDSSGNLYGTTEEGGASNAGTVFELANSSGTYTEKVLYSFSGGSTDGQNPASDVTMDASGNFYGTTEAGGASNGGTVFELVNSSGSYTEKLLHSFAGGSADGSKPYAGLIPDSSGNLYSTTELGGPSNLGAVFELVNSSGTYTEQLLYLFPAGGNLGSGPYAGLVMDASGNLYGAAYGGGSNACPSTCGLVFGISAQQQSGLLGSNNTFTGMNTFTQAITGSITGNAGTVTNGVYMTGLYADPSWITSLSAGKITGTVASAAVAGTATTAGALAATPTQCGTNTFSTGIAANGNANCAQPASTNLSDYSTLVLNNQANTFAGGKQSLAPSAAGYASLNLPDTGTAPSTPAMGDLWLTTGDAHPKFQDRTNTTQSLAFLSDVNSSNLLSSNNTFTGTNTFSQTINGSISGNAATSAVTAASATTATSALTATTAGSATTAGALAATPTQCGTGMFATGIAANGNANCGPASTGVAGSQILFASAGIPVWNGAFMGISAPSVTEASVEQIMTVSGHITAMQCYSQVAPKGSSETFTLGLNGANTAGACTIAAGSTKGSVTALNLSLAAGNLLDLKVSGPKTLGAATVAVAVGP